MICSSRSRLLTKHYFLASAAGLMVMICGLLTCVLAGWLAGNNVLGLGSSDRSSLTRTDGHVLGFRAGRIGGKYSAGTCEIETESNVITMVVEG